MVKVGINIVSRLDVEIVRRGLEKSRNKAILLIKGGQVFVNNKCVLKAGFEIDENADAKIEIRGEVNPYVSRGGLKLEKAVKTFGIDLKDKIVIDIGSSSGGFTDCVLHFGAKKVYAIDVGKNQFDKNLKKNRRIVLYEETDFRQIGNDLINDATFAVADVSFISLTKLLDKLSTLLNLTDLIFLIKPQFECGAEIAKKYKGVIKDKDVHYDVLANVLTYFFNYKFYCLNLTYSPITGGDGNIEYIAHFVNAKNLQKARYICDKGNVSEEDFNAITKYNEIFLNLSGIISSAFNQFW